MANDPNAVIDDTIAQTERGMLQDYANWGATLKDQVQNSKAVQSVGNAVSDMWNKMTNFVTGKKSEYYGNRPEKRRYSGWLPTEIKHIRNTKTNRTGN